jgi:hypothetical protein
MEVPSHVEHLILMFLQALAAVLQSRADRSRTSVHAVVRLQNGKSWWGLK